MLSDIKNENYQDNLSGGEPEEKIAFMNYLPISLHESFNYKLLAAKQKLRKRTRKTLSQTELVEAILSHTINNWDALEEKILNEAENTILKRK